MNAHFRRWLLVSAMALLAPASGQAHTLPGAAVGWTDGFSHPWHGWDHLLVMLAVGFWAAQQRGWKLYRLPLVFAAVMALGGVAGAASLPLPGAEIVILLSVPVFGFLVVQRVKLDFCLSAALVGFFAFFHGFAHGVEMPDSAGLGSFALGFVLATLLLHGLGLVGARLMVLGTACLLGASAEAGRPLVIDDAGPAAPGEVEVELGAGYFDDAPTRHWHVPVNLAYGLSPRFEVGVSGGQHFREHVELGKERATEVGFGDVGLGLKWQPLDANRFAADQALALGVKLPTASRHHGLGTGEVDCDLTWIASKPVNDHLSVHLNAGYSWLGDPPDERIYDVVHYGAALTWRTRERLELVAEVYANNGVGNSTDDGVFASAGLRWRLFPNLVLDAAAGGTIHGAGPDFIATFGLTWTFGPLKRTVRERGAAMNAAWLRLFNAQCEANAYPRN